MRAVVASGAQVFGETHPWVRTGSLLVCKIAGAAASAGLSLEEARIANRPFGASLVLLNQRGHENDMMFATITIFQRHAFQVQ